MTNVIQLNEQQNEMLNKIQDILHNQSNGLFVVSGVAGSGKTTVLDQVIKNYEAKYGREFKDVEMPDGHKHMIFTAYSNSACDTLTTKIDKEVGMIDEASGKTIERKDVKTLARLFTRVHSPFEVYPALFEWSMRLDNDYSNTMEEWQNLVNLNEALWSGEQYWNRLTDKQKADIRFLRKMVKIPETPCLTTYQTDVKSRFSHCLSKDMPTEIKQIFDTVDNNHRIEPEPLLDYLKAMRKTPLFEKITEETIMETEYLTDSIIIVDESSMVDEEYYNLLMLLSEHTLVFCFGDKGQLPPISKSGFFLYKKVTDYLFVLTKSERSGTEQINTFHRLGNYSTRNIINTFGLVKDDADLFERAYVDGETFGAICFKHDNRVWLSLEYMVRHPHRQKVSQVTLPGLYYVKRISKSNIEKGFQKFPKKLQYLIPVVGDTVFAEKERTVLVNKLDENGKIVINPDNGRPVKEQKILWRKDNILRLTKIDYSIIAKGIIFAEVEKWCIKSKSWISVDHAPYDNLFPFSIFKMFMGNSKMMEPSIFKEVDLPTGQNLTCTPITHDCSMTTYRSQGKEFDNVAVILDSWGEVEQANNYTAGTRAIKTLVFAGN